MKLITARKRHAWASVFAVVFDMKDVQVIRRHVNLNKWGYQFSQTVKDRHILIYYRLLYINRFPPLLMTLDDLDPRLVPKCLASVVILY